MEVFEKLYDEQEKAKVRFIGFTDGNTRYDFGIVFTSLFFGKPLVICMQSGCSTLLDPNDLEDVDHIQSAFKIKDTEEAHALVEFFKNVIPEMPFQPQYD